MAAPADCAVALLSIHPRYAEAILGGEKRVEFRKRPFGRRVEQVVIYATAPVQRIVGAFVVEGIDVDSPDALWDRYAAVGAIDKHSFDSYFADAGQGVAIRVSDVTPAVTDVPLAALGDLCPPQSYLYLEFGALCRLGPVLGTAGKAPAASG